MTGGRAGLVEQAIEQCEGAILNRDLRHDGSLSLTRHVLNSRRRMSHGRLALAKESPRRRRRSTPRWRWSCAGKPAWQQSLPASGCAAVGSAARAGLGCADRAVR
jgi:hypothetical protein